MARKDTWTKEEEKKLLSLWGKERLVKICKSLKRSRSSVTKRAKKLGIYDKKLETKKRWTKEEKQFLIDNYNLLSYKELEEKLKTNKEAILKQAQYLNITEGNRYWTNEEEEYLTYKWGLVTIDYMSKKLDRTHSAILLKANDLGLKEQIIGNGEYLTPQNIQTILNKPMSTIYNLIKKGYIKSRRFKIKKLYKYQISIDNFKEFLQKYPNLWDSRTSDIITIKSYFSSYNISNNGNYNIKIPNWLNEKIEKEKNMIRKENNVKMWTIIEEHLLYELFLDNVPIKEICKILDRSYYSVIQKLNKIKKTIKE